MRTAASGMCPKTFFFFLIKCTRPWSSQMPGIDSPGTSKQKQTHSVRDDQKDTAAGAEIVLYNIIQTRLYIYIIFCVYSPQESFNCYGNLFTVRSVRAGVRLSAAAMAPVLPAARTPAETVSRGPEDPAVSTKSVCPRPSVV